MIGDIILLREETRRNKWAMVRVTLIPEDNNSFIQIVNIAVGTNASKTFGTQILERHAKEFTLLVKSIEENNSE